MNILDIVLAVPTLYLVYKGWRHGLVREVANLAGLVAGIWCALHLSQWTAEQLGLTGESAVLIAFLVTFLAAIVLAYLLGRSIEGLLKAARLSVVNRLAGALLGMAKALCILSVLLSYVILIDKQEQLVSPTVKEQSLLFKPVYHTGSRLTASLKSYIADHQQEWKEALQ